MIDVTRRADADVVALVPERVARAFAEAGFSLFDDKVAMGGRATAYDCHGFVVVSRPPIGAVTV